MRSAMTTCCNTTIKYTSYNDKDDKLKNENKICARSMIHRKKNDNVESEKLRTSIGLIVRQAHFVFISRNSKTSRNSKRIN